MGLLALKFQRAPRIFQSEGYGVDIVPIFIRRGAPIYARASQSMQHCARAACANLHRALIRLSLTEAAKLLGVGSAHHHRPSEQERTADGRCYRPPSPRARQASAGSALCARRENHPTARMS
jgi:hypothetical protein